MAQRNSSGRGGTATRTKRQGGNQTPGTPGISESEISRLRVDEIRVRLRRQGVSGISALRKPELVKLLARTMRSGRRGGGAARTSTGPAGRATSTAARRTTGTPSARAKAAPARARKATPAQARKAAPAQARKTSSAQARKASPSARKASPAQARKTSSAAARKTSAAPARKASSAGGATARKATASGTAGASGRRTASGGTTSRSVRSSQLIASPADRPERPGRSLVTTNHEVIQRWARARNAKPATIAGTERNGRPGVLTFNFPGYRESSRVREITWDDWFRTFDGRRLNLIFQEQMRDGRQSNFFRTESPQREDA
ncbi:hypothetical protein E1091_00860 [Micromonospora fluostatini]|uniref:Rho termination factor N-terminal domain-containing protein n=1 Tax=Micromonospora fluostatini TaxID=1629071 RepID=A0ABY2DMM0_9ACTN|nr:hypothetical protein E1091_00860 [Micromonospora fluostatini]